MSQDKKPEGGERKLTEVFKVDATLDFHVLKPVRVRAHRGRRRYGIKNSMLVERRHRHRKQCEWAYSGRDSGST